MAMAVTPVQVLVTTLLGLSSTVTADQTIVRSEFSSNPRHALTKWDASSQSLFLYREASAADSEAVLRYDSAGRRAGDPISPLRDLPDARKFAIWDVAGNASGAVAVLGVAQYGEEASHDVRHVILIYGKTGLLENVWPMEPYHHHRIVLGEDGSLFALGHRLDGPREPYPLLIKYSAAGRVEREALLTSEVDGGDAVIDSTDQDAVFLSSDATYLYAGIARMRQVLQFNGELARVRTRPLPDEQAIARGAQAARATLNAVAIGPTGLAVQYRVAATTAQPAVSACTTSLLTLTAPSGLPQRQLNLTEKMAHDSLLGITSHGLLFASPMQEDATVVLSIVQ